MSTFLTLNVSKFMGTDEYNSFIYDVLRMLTLQVVYQVMMIITNPEQFYIMQNDYIEVIFYTFIGIMAYWMIVKKFVQIV